MTAPRKRHNISIQQLAAELDDLRRQVAGILKLLARDVDNDRSIVGFCRRQGISRSSFYNLLKAGKGPRISHIGGRRTITPEAERAWEIEREAEGQAA